VRQIFPPVASKRALGTDCAALADAITAAVEFAKSPLTDSIAPDES
jgi:hypothetical protein